MTYEMVIMKLRFPEAYQYSCPVKAHDADIRYLGVEYDLKNYAN